MAITLGPFPVLLDRVPAQNPNMKIPSPLPLRHQHDPFNDRNWIYEIKHDGFRALAVIEHGSCRFLSRNRHNLYGFRDLATALVREVTAKEAVLDGELAVSDPTGRTIFSSMMQRRKGACYFAFDLLWLNGQDLCAQPLLAEKNN